MHGGGWLRDEGDDNDDVFTRSNPTATTDFISQDVSDLGKLLWVIFDQGSLGYLWIFFVILGNIE